MPVDKNLICGILEYRSNLQGSEAFTYMLITQNEASRYPYAPTRQYLNKLSKDTPLPAFMQIDPDDDGKIKIDPQHPAWVELLKEREARMRAEAKGEKKKRGVQPGTIKPMKKVKPVKVAKAGTRKEQTQKATAADKPGTLPAAPSNAPPTNPPTNPDIDDLINQATIAKWEEQILKNEGQRYKNEQQKMRLKIAAGELIEFKLAEFLFFGYMEKLNIELLGLCKKIEPMVDNLVKEGKTKDILKLFNRHFGNILGEVKKAQGDDVKEWQEEAGKK